jgi:hypothetical protein
VHRRALYSSLFFVLLAVVPGRAQQGHPLTGTWSGDWGPEGARRTATTLVLNWDGKNVTGIINPGPDSIQIVSVYVDYSNWTVRIEADAKDSSDKAVHISAEGKLDDLGSYHRTIKGVWEQGKVKGEFRLTRD